MRKIACIFVSAFLCAAMFDGCENSKNSDSKAEKSDICQKFEETFNMYMDGRSPLGSDCNEMFPYSLSYYKYDQYDPVNKENYASEHKYYLGEMNEFAGIEFGDAYSLTAITVDNYNRDLYSIELKIGFTDDRCDFKYPDDKEKCIELASRICAEICERKKVEVDESTIKQEITDNEMYYILEDPDEGVGEYVAVDYHPDIDLFCFQYDETELWGNELSKYNDDPNMACVVIKLCDARKLVVDKSKNGKYEDTSDGVVGDNNGDGKINEEVWEEEWKNYLNEKMN